MKSHPIDARRATRRRTRASCPEKRKKIPRACRSGFCLVHKERRDDVGDDARRVVDGGARARARRRREKLLAQKSRDANVLRLLVPLLKTRRRPDATSHGSRRAPRIRDSPTGSSPTACRGPRATLPPIHPPSSRSTFASVAASYGATQTSSAPRHPRGAFRSTRTELTARSPCWPRPKARAGRS